MAMASSAVVITPFDPNAEKYNCCCHHMLCTTGLKVLLVFQIIIVLLNLVSLIGGVHATSIIDIILGIGIAVCLYMALRTEKHTWLLPLLIVLGISIAILVIGAVLAVGCTIVGSELFRESLVASDPRYEELSESVDLTTFGISVSISLAGCALVVIWLFTIVKGAYEFYKDKASYRAAAAVAQAQHPGASAPPAYYPAAAAPYPLK